MALMSCPECQSKVSAQAERCPSCAFPIAAHFEKVEELRLAEEQYSQESTIQGNHLLRSSLGKTAFTWLFAIIIMISCFAYLNSGTQSFHPRVESLVENEKSPQMIQPAMSPSGGGKVAKNFSQIIDDKYTKAGKKVHTQHPEWNYLACNLIGKKQIAVGMNSEQVRAAWGRPYRINKTMTDDGVTEQWVMRGSLPTAYVYFEDGTCTAIQN